MQNYCYHIHTPRCGHADNTMWEADIARMFYEAGFKNIAFTDHGPWKTFLEPYKDHAMKWEDKEEYLASVNKLKEEYKGKMNILAGFEIEVLPHLQDEMDEIRKLSDIIVHGQHYVQSEDGTFKRMHGKGFAPNDYEMDYYANVIDYGCKTGFTDIIAHPDLYMHHKTEFGKKEEEIAHKICQSAERYDVPVEINLCVPSKSVFYEPCPITYPRREFWNIAKNYKVRTVVGLDFHGHFHPKHFDDAFNLAVETIGEDIISQLNILSSAPDLK